MAICINERHLASFASVREVEILAPLVREAARILENGTGPGNDFLGWLRLPENHDREELCRIKAAAQKIQSDSKLLVVVGIGGSYLGARSAIEYLKSPQYNALPKDTPDILFAGCTLSGAYMNEILTLCQGRDFSINVVSKSGTTTEPALAFRVLRRVLEERYGKEEAARRIYCTTDKARGTMKELADREGWETFVIPDDVGGRFSVLTAVGLLPMAVAGIDLDRVLAGALDAQKALMEPDPLQNPAYRYAAWRNVLYRRGKTTEVFVAHDPAFTQMGEWLKQLFGESEGKDGKGLLPASMIFSTELHSMGQFVQDGSRSLFETVIDIREPCRDFFVEDDPENLDGLNFLSGQQMSAISRRAPEGTVLAHTRGGVPNLILEVPRRDEFEYGWMVYFFEKACAVSGYLLGVNPFDQPGVEAYKQNMFALLGKPGSEALRAQLLSQLE